MLFAAVRCHDGFRFCSHAIRVGPLVRLSGSDRFDSSDARVPEVEEVEPSVGGITNILLEFAGIRP